MKTHIYENFGLIESELRGFTSEHEIRFPLNIFIDHEEVKAGKVETFKKYYLLS